MSRHRATEDRRRDLELARAGDETAFGRLVEAYRARLLERIRMMMGAEARRAAESTDFVQDVLTDVLGRREATPLDSERALLRWMTAMARNRIRDALRRDRERSFSTFSGSLVVDGDQETPLHGVGEREREFLLAEALESLADGERRTIERRAFDGCDFESIGRERGTSADAARKRYGRAILRLGQALRSLDD